MSDFVEKKKDGRGRPKGSTKKVNQDYIKTEDTVLVENKPAKREKVIFQTRIRNLQIRLRNPVKDEKGKVLQKAKFAIFNGGRYVTSDPEDIEILRSCELYGIDYRE